MSRQAAKKLLRAVLEPRQQGALEQIARACAAGADPNAICPECSTSRGSVRGGSTLLTHSVHEGAANAVERLLDSGADPNLVDQNCWTPWMASTLTDESKRRRIQDLLAENGARQDREYIGQLVRAVADGDASTAAELIEADQDLVALATFRVDLLGRQIASGNADMLELLLKRGMKPTSTNYINTIRNRSLPCLDLLLRHGMSPEEPDDDETPLMTAAGMGAMQIVQRLVEAGADVNRSADGNAEWTAAFYANKAGHSAVSEWLTARMSAEIIDHQNALMEARAPKFRSLYEHATVGESLSTDEIVATLSRWDKDYGINVRHANEDSVTIEFSRLPEQFDVFYAELQKFCPDVAEDRRAVKDEFEKHRSILLWWD